MKKEVVEKFALLITSAFGLVAALAWNSAIQGLFTEFFGTNGGLFAMFFYAILVTIIAVLVTLWIGRVSEKKKRK